MRTVNLTGANQDLGLVPAPYLYYRGFAIRETTGSAPASVVVYDGTTATGLIIDEIVLTAAKSLSINYGHPKIARIGIYISVVSGSVAGSISVD
jgi:hypothetical protein